MQPYLAIPLIAQHASLLRVVEGGLVVLPDHFLAVSLAPAARVVRQPALELREIFVAAGLVNE